MSEFQQESLPEPLPPEQGGDRLLAPREDTVRPEPAETRLLKWLLFGPHGVRAGWSAVLFLVLMLLATFIAGAGASLLLKTQHASPGHFAAVSAIFGDGLTVIGLAAALFAVSRIERRQIGSYYLGGRQTALKFLGGATGGFLALSVLVFTLYFGGFLHFSPATLGLAEILRFGLLWAIAFLLVGLSEEGMFRTYLLYTLARGMNFWWSAGCVGALCLFALLNTKGNGSAGVYMMAALGVAPCFRLHQTRSPASGFWQAAWFTSTAFGYVHTFNPGESWIGIFSAAAIGFVFCVSVRLTGSAWWAIGFHAAWDWTQTFFYGTPDSGLAPQGHYLSTAPDGAAFWSGGKDGPEGSILVLPIVLLTLLVVTLLYRRRSLPESPSTAVEAQLS